MTRVLKLAESGVDAAADAVLEALAGPGARGPCCRPRPSTDWSAAPMTRPPGSAFTT